MLTTMAAPTNGAAPDELNYLIPRLQSALLARNVPIPPWRARSQDEHKGLEPARDNFVLDLARILAEEKLLPSESAMAAAKELAQRMIGLGVLEPFLHQLDVEEVIVRNGLVQVIRAGKTEVVLHAPDEYFHGLAQRAAEMGGKPLRAAEPFVSVALPDGSRFTAMIPPLSRRGTAITIRVFARRDLSLDQMVAEKVISERQMEFLKNAVQRFRTSILISGRPGAGKTTLLNSLLGLIPLHLQTQLCAAETFEELHIPNPHTARAVVSDSFADGDGVSMSDVVNTLYTRMRPRVLVIGEIVDAGEAREFIRALNLGVVAHATIHGNSVLDALYRLEDLASEGNLALEQAYRERIARGIGIGIHIDTDIDANGNDGPRRVKEIVRIASDGTRYVLGGIGD
ncbi:MAG: CpaF family protein [Chloroflexi bacterium]|nr:CpaF family protein [Chloroflexota bacterium]